ncbi:adenine deaminase [Acididesulfobacillus acetoxydans]|uniref:Adenine deaminase n=1 Tax=Acididesulfobacillus acetoxydans TaxID=1561005 RepID=A0A8S0W2Y2_9FIRM|nr:adenine deaminase C-terminal domain-containing protein [Acididesulfobacillus acetoxydans]CAA7601118.1 adenine deaminase [Acididesulfobacillus acetoxydans]CEJ08603.1 Adenine deaminase [Acididesulfobacillus acetoxydans]
MLETRAGLIQVALGRRAPELLLHNIRLVNVYSGEILEGQAVAVWRGRIAYVGPEARAGENTEIVDGEGMYLLPGLIDVHGHADIIVNPLVLAENILPTGTTAMLTDTHDISGALGTEGFERMLEATRSIPFRYYFAAPATCPPLSEFEGREIFSAADVARFLARPRVLAVSEVTSWGRLTAAEPDQELLAKLVAAKAEGKRIEGHMSGCSYEKLNALTAAGFSSCHESITAEEALHRLRLGLYVALRHGSIRADLAELSRLITENPGLDTARVMLTPDWFAPQDLLRHGYMNYLVAYAVELGVPPVRAIQMVTINPATYLGLDQEIGGVAPGRLADMLLVPDIRRPEPQQVWVGGQTVAADGKLLVSIPSFPRTTLADWRTGRVPRRPVEAQDFVLESDGDTSVPLPCIHMVNKTITKERVLDVPIVDGRLEISGLPGVMKISLWAEERQEWTTGLLGGFGAEIGGYASAIAHETHLPMVVGSSDEEMAQAANRMLEIGGGAVLVDGGRIIGEVPLGIGGLLSGAGLSETAAAWMSLNTYLQGKGCPWDDPLFGLGFLAFTGLPYVRITPRGIVDVRKQKVIFKGRRGAIT